MHPIERLRYVARADGAGVSDLVSAAAHALAGLGDDEASLVTGCRQMVDRHPAIGPLWFLASRMLCSPSPSTEAWAVADEIEADLSPRLLAGELPQDAVVLVLGSPELIGGALHRRGDLRVRVVDDWELASVLAESGSEVVEVPASGIGAAAADADIVLLEALALGPTGIVSIAGSRAAAAVARHAGRQVWVLAGHGRLLPGRLWEALLGRLEVRGEPWTLEEEVVPSDLVDVVAGPWGRGSFADAVGHTDCPVAAELFKGVYAPGTFEPDTTRSSGGPGGYRRRRRRG